MTANWYHFAVISWSGTCNFFNFTKNIKPIQVSIFYLLNKKAAWNGMKQIVTPVSWVKLVQWIEYQEDEPKVPGSIPTTSTIGEILMHSYVHVLTNPIIYPQVKNIDGSTDHWVLSITQGRKDWEDRKGQCFFHIYINIP